MNRRATRWGHPILPVATLPVATLLLATLLSTVACGGDPPEPEPVVVFIPTEPRPPAECDALTNQGCEAGEKCTFVYLDPEQAYGQTECAADGTLDIGAQCEMSALGVADDCQSGSMCFRGTCKEICTVADDQCAAGTICGRFTSLFQDQLSGDVGLCSPTCNAVLQNCDGEDACYLRELDGLAACSRVPPEAALNVQDIQCLGPAANQCYTNGCAKGFNTFFISTLCQQVCTPVATGVGALDGIRGNANGVQCGDFDASAGEINNTECRFFNAIGAPEPAGDASNSLGICMSAFFRDAAGLGSCTTHDLNAAATPANIENGTYVLGCEPLSDQAAAARQDAQALRAYKQALADRIEALAGEL